MAAGRLPKPGTEFGPCEPECGHIDCKQTREMAQAVCHYCEKPIGYETRFYVDVDKKLVHAICLETSIEETRNNLINALNVHAVKGGE